MRICTNIKKYHRPNHHLLAIITWLFVPVIVNTAVEAITVTPATVVSLRRDQFYLGRCSGTLPKSANTKHSFISPSRGGASSNPSSNVSVSDLTIYQRLFAGGISRGFAQALLYPVDALRTLAQTRDHRTLADVGGKALVRGCLTTSTFALFIGSIQLAIFGTTKPYVGPVLASALGAAGSCLISVPQEVIKQRLVTGIYPRFTIAVKTIFKDEGIKGFYSAWRPTMSRNVPFVVIVLTTNDILKQKILSRKRKQQLSDDDSISTELSVRENFVIGITSALIAGAITQPIDVVKTRMMTQAASSAIPYANNIDCVKTILQTESIASFYAGFLQRSLYMGPLWAIQLSLNGRISEMFIRSQKERTK